MSFGSDIAGEAARQAFWWLIGLVVVGAVIGGLIVWFLLS